MNRGQILDTIRHNFETNGKICAKSNVKVEEIDFFRIDRWRQKLGQEIAESNLILAADVVYDQELTSRFFDALTAILKDNKSDARVLIGRFILIKSEYTECNEHNPLQPLSAGTG